jgi:hypothetical protein
VKLITHVDIDGICCAALFILKFGETINITYATVQQAKELSSANFQVDYTCDLPKVSQSVNIDHHKTNFEKLIESNRLSPEDLVVPDASSATDLVFDYLGFSDDPIAEEVKELGHLADLALLPAEYKPLDIVLNMNVEDSLFLRTISELLAKYGKEILKTQWLKEQHLKVVTVYEETHQVIKTFLDNNPLIPRIVIIDSRKIIPGKLAKEVFRPLFDQGAIIIALIYQKSSTEPVRISFRVAKAEQDNYDVSIVARNFGGGGHRMAAACSVNPLDIPEKLMNQLKTIVLRNDTVKYFSLESSREL